MLRQKTFTVVPNPLGMQGLVQRPPGQAPSRPPMTTKQAQKLYRQATRQPKLSKAEQRRREKEEQERIRKELDKEKQASRARSARQQKKEREQRALEEKKRKGLPTVKVSASQDTISRFVRGNNLGRKRDSSGNQLNLQPIAEESENAASETEGASEGEATLAAIQSEKETTDETTEQLDSQLKATKRLRIDSCDESKTVERGGETAEADGQEAAPGHGGSLPDQRSRQSSLNADDPAIEDMVNTQLITEAAAAAGSSPNRPWSPQPHVTGPPSHSDHTAKQKELVKSLSSISARPESQKAPGRQTREPVQASSMHPPHMLAQDPLQQCIPLQETSANRPNVARQEEKAKLVQRCPPPFIPAPKSLPHTKPPAMAPPAFVPRFKPQSPAENGRAERPRFLPKHLRTPASRPSLSKVSKLVELRPQGPSDSSMPPTSTQLFVLSHLDDLFPTPSQEALELQLPGVSPLPVSKPVVPCPPVPPKHQQASRQEPRLLNGHCAITAPAESLPQGASATLPFFSTQDFVLSSQDIRDVEQTSDTPSKIRNNIGRARNPQSARAVGHTRPNLPNPGFTRACATVAAQIPKPSAQSSLAGIQHRSVVADTDCHHGRGAPVSNRIGAQISSGYQTPRRSFDRALGQPSQKSNCNAGVTGQLQVQSEDRPPTDSIGKATSQRSLHPMPEVGNAGRTLENRSPRPSASASKKRFFTSSNNEGFYLGKERSIRTLQEEERMREASCQGRVELGRKLRVGSEIEDADDLAQRLSVEAGKRHEQGQSDQALQEEQKRKELEELEMLALQLHDEADEFDDIEPTDGGGRKSPQHKHDNDLNQCQAERASGSRLELAVVEKQAPSEIKLSQETDYGDLGWSESELEALDTLAGSPEEVEYDCGFDPDEYMRFQAFMGLYPRSDTFGYDEFF